MINKNLLNKLNKLNKEWFDNKEPLMVRCGNCNEKFPYQDLYKHKCFIEMAIKANNLNKPLDK